MNKTYQRINWQNEPSIATPLNEVNLNKVDYSLNEVDNRVISLDTSKANQSDLLQTIKTLTYNTTTGVFTFTFWNGSTYTVDLNIEKIPVDFSMDEYGVITMTTADGTEYTCDISELIKLYTFVDSSEIDFTVTTDASGNKTITAGIKEGSIVGSKLQPNFLADCQTAKNQAESAAGSASSSATSSELSSEDSEAWAVGERNGVPVPSTDPAYQNNAKYWSEQSNPTTFASMSDVDFNNLQNGQVPVYNSTTNKWENGAGGGGASLPIDISDNVNNVTGILKIANGGTGNSSGYVRVGQKANTTIGTGATAEGTGVTASGNYSHGEGADTTAQGTYAHAEGRYSEASGIASHAEGNTSQAQGMYSHAEGTYTIAKGDNSHTQGKFNIKDNNNTYAHIVGNGTSNIARSNAHTLDWSGNAWFAGTVTDGTGNVLSAKANTTDVNNKHKITNFEVSTSGWTADTTSQSGTTLYKKQVSLSHVYANPSVDIGALTGNVLPTTAEQTAYNLVQYVTVDDTVPCLYLYASDTPTNAFNIDVEGVD